MSTISSAHVSDSASIMLADIVHRGRTCKFARERTGLQWVMRGDMGGRNRAGKAHQDPDATVLILTAAELP